MSMNVIEASGLAKRYGSTWALREPGAVALPGPARVRALPLETGQPSEVTR